VEKKIDPIVLARTVLECSLTTDIDDDDVKAWCMSQPDCSECKERVIRMLLKRIESNFRPPTDADGVEWHIGDIVAPNECLDRTSVVTAMRMIVNSSGLHWLVEFHAEDDTGRACDAGRVRHGMTVTTRFDDYYRTRSILEGRIVDAIDADETRSLRKEIDRLTSGLLEELGYHGV